WIVGLPGALYGGIRARRKHAGARLALTWFLFTFLFFSVISGKKTRYLLPLFPAASLLVAIDLRALLQPGPRPEGAAGRRRALATLAICAGFIMCAGAVLIAGAMGGLARVVAHASGLSPDQVAGLEIMAHPPRSLALALPGLVLVS